MKYMKWPLDLIAHRPPWTWRAELNSGHKVKLLSSHVGECIVVCFVGGTEYSDKMNLGMKGFFWLTLLRYSPLCQGSDPVWKISHRCAGKFVSVEILNPVKLTSGLMITGNR